MTVKVPQRGRNKGEGKKGKATLDGLRDFCMLGRRGKGGLGWGAENQGSEGEKGYWGEIFPRKWEKGSAPLHGLYLGKGGSSKVWGVWTEQGEE